VAPWRFVVCDTTGRALGEPRAYERTLSFEISRAATGGFRIRDTDPLYDDIVAGETMVKVYDGLERLVCYGPIISDTEEGQGSGGATVRVAFTDIFWRLSKRFVGKKAAVSDGDLAYTSTDSGAIAHALLALANADASTGITVGTKDTFVARTVNYGWKRVSDAISELGAIDGSYEWGLRYVDGTPPTVYLDLKTSFGQTRTQTFFEYGTGRKNCQGYSRSRSADTQATRVWALGAGSAPPVTASDTGAEASYGRLEEVVSYGDVSVQSLLGVLASAHVAVRARPRTLVNLTPFPKSAPVFGTDWEVGDIVQARAVVANRVRVSGAVRVWGADFTISELGDVVPTLKLVAS
jgi:hypothetical protein